VGADRSAQAGDFFAAAIPCRHDRELQRFVESEIAKWAVPIKAANIRGE
jgi:hypothetical protein